MTMQTNSLPFQVSGANAPAQRAGGTPDRLAGSARDNGGFGATLSREISARQQPAAQQSKPAQQGSKPNSADKPVQREPVRENAAKAGAKPASHEGEAETAKSAQAAAGAESEEADDAVSAAEAAASAPVTEMLAFMASLSQPTSAAATVAEDATLTSASELQLTALENALEHMTGAGAAATDDAAGATLATDDSGAGFSLASGVKQAPIEARADAQAHAGNALPQGQDDAAQFQAQLRESHQQAASLSEEAPAPLAQLQAQAAKLDATGNPAAVPGDRIPARVGTQAWDNQVSQRIVYMVGKEQAATLTLNPPDLGPVQIVLNVSNDQASVAFSSQQLEVRQALENALPRLREMMNESGIALNNATVDAGVPDQRQQHDSERRAHGGQGGNGGLAGTGGEAEGALNEVAPRTRTVSVGERGMVDLYA